MKSDGQAGYDGDMHPPGGNRDAFNAGIAARQHDQAMADMSARHYAAMNQFQVGPNPSSAPVFGGGGGAPMTPGERRMWLIILAILLVILAGIAIVLFAAYAIDDGLKSAHSAESERLAAEAQRQTDATWQPVLRRALVSFDVQRDIAAIDRATEASPCYREVITQVMAGRRLGFVHCPSPGSFASTFRAYVDSDRFSVEYVTSNPTIRTRMNVMPIESWSMNARPANGKDAPVKVAIAQLGAETVTRYSGQGCVVIDARRYASNRLPEEDASGRSASVPASYASLARVSIACGAGESRQLVATKLWTPN